MATYTGSDKRLAYLFGRTQDMTGATASTDGAAGIIPAPEAGDEEKFLRGDGEWAEAGERFDETETKIGVCRYGTVYQKSFLCLSDADFELLDSDLHLYRFDTGISGNWQLLSLDCVSVTTGGSMWVYPSSEITSISGSPGSSYLLFTKPGNTSGGVFLRLKYFRLT